MLFGIDDAAQITASFSLACWNRERQELLEPITVTPPPNIPASKNIRKRILNICKHGLKTQLCIRLEIEETQLDVYATGAEPIPLLELGRFHFMISEINVLIPQAKSVFAKHDIPLNLFDRGCVLEDAPPLNSMPHTV